MNVDILKTTDRDFEARFARLLDRSGEGSREVADRVTEILEAVRDRGDSALVELTRKLDQRPGLGPEDLPIPSEALQTALDELAPDVKEALQRAAGRIRAFHGLQRAQIDDVVLEDGRGLSARLLVRPLRSVGVYVPGGTAAYPSTVLMNAIPAKVAGVPEVVMVTPARGGRVAPAVLAAACLAGVDRVFGIGGAQAIAALAYGTETIPRVDKIVGPGNAYVAEAKRQVFGRVGIDQIAGPSEVLIVADESAEPALVAADMLAQAEHDVVAAAIAVVWSESQAEAIRRELDGQLSALPRASIVAQALAARGGVILARDQSEALQVANRYAPEHLGLAVENAEEMLDDVENAGAVFLGRHTAEALGDYNAGVNHVLPTAGTARFGSPLSVHDFSRRTSVLSANATALARIGPDAALLAREEGLEAHARAVELRLSKGDSNGEREEEEER